MLGLMSRSDMLQEGLKYRTAPPWHPTVVEADIACMILINTKANMRLFTAIVAVAGLLGHAFAQTSTFFSPGVPTDAPIPGNYTGPYRPRVHFSPPQNFMNDPNGMFMMLTEHGISTINTILPVSLLVINIGAMQ